VDLRAPKEPYIRLGCRFLNGKGISFFCGGTGGQQRCDLSLPLQQLLVIVVVVSRIVFSTYYYDPSRYSGQRKASVRCPSVRLSVCPVKHILNRDAVFLNFKRPGTEFSICARGGPTNHARVLSAWWGPNPQ